MRCAYLILPTTSNDEVDQTDTHAALQSALCDYFGGFTMTQGKGGWRNPANARVYMDSVATYAIAMTESGDNESRLESIARFYGHMAGQVCVMLAHASGRVVFVDSNVLESV